MRLASSIQGLQSIHPAEPSLPRPAMKTLTYLFGWLNQAILVPPLTSTLSSFLGNSILNSPAATLSFAPHRARSLPLHLDGFYNNKASSNSNRLQNLSHGLFDGQGGAYAADLLPIGPTQVQGVWVSLAAKPSIRTNLTAVSLLHHTI